MEKKVKKNSLSIKIEQPIENPGPGKIKIKVNINLMICKSDFLVKKTCPRQIEKCWLVNFFLRYHTDWIFNKNYTESLPQTLISSLQPKVADQIYIFQI